MNIYRIKEDGIDYIWKAESMEKACKLAEQKAVEENDFGRPWYRSYILESCEFIGELVNE